MSPHHDTARTAELRIEIRGLAGGAGTVNLALFDAPEGFHVSPMIPTAGQRLPARTDGVVAVFTGLAPGDYAMSTFHDENDNGVLDRNLLGRPTERFGFSRDAMGTMGPPSFEAARVTLAAGGAETIVVNLR